MISWGIARSIAVTLASRTEGPIPAKQGDFDYASAVGKYLGPLEDFTGIDLTRSGERPIRVASRAEWIDFNISSFGALLEPILKRAAAGSGNELTWAFGAATLTGQMGFLLGFLSARVLGQYDTGPLVVGKSASAKKPGEPGEVFFLDGNIVSAAGRLGVPVEGLRLYIVLHEMTHALQFEGHPWLRDHLGSLVESFTGPLAEKLGLTETLRRLLENRRTGGRSIELMMTGGQREAFDRMQGTMSIIEGYSDYVMHHVGRRVVPGYEDLTRKMSRSRMHRPPFETAIFRLTGLDMKLEQYRMGEEFADAVARRAGMQGLNHVWDGPESMPSLAEIRDPGLWMDRVLKAA